MAYEIPKDENGEIDFDELNDDLREGSYGPGYDALWELDVSRDEMLSVLKAIDANARAEERKSYPSKAFAHSMNQSYDEAQVRAEERERCAAVCMDGVTPESNANAPAIKACVQNALSIRNMEDKT
jgi:hypothetical protein